MAFFRKAFHKISHAQESSNAGGIKPASSTTAGPIQHDFGVARWDGTLPHGAMAVPMSMSNSDSSRSPSSKISFLDRDGGFKTDDTALIPPPKFAVSSGGYNEDSGLSLTPTRTNESMRHRSPKKPSTSSFRPFLANLAGLKISSHTADAQDHDASDVSLPLPTPEPLSSKASTPISIFPPPPPSGRRRRRQQDSSIEATVQSSDNTTFLLPVSFDNSSTPAIVDAAMTKRLEAAASQARLHAALGSESSVSVDVLPELAGSWRSGDERPLNHIEPNLLAVDKKPVPSEVPVHSSQTDLAYLLPGPRFDVPFLPNGPLIHPNQQPTDSNTSPTLDLLDHILRQPDPTEENILPEGLRDDEFKPTSKTQIPGAYLVDDITPAPATTPPPIPSAPVSEELHILRSRLAEYKRIIGTLAEEKLALMQNHRRELLLLEETVANSRAQIKELISGRERLMVDRDDVVQQLKAQIDENENLEQENKELREYKLKARIHEVDYQRLFKEKESWQGQIDSMHQRLSDAERRVRCLDITTRQKYEAKQDRAYGSGSTVGRSTKLHFSPHVKGPSMDVIISVTTFNEEVLQTASYVVEHLEELQSNSTLVMSKEVTRAKEIWGQKVVAMLQQQAQSSSRLNILLLKNCLEVFMTHWCAQIVEGWYPKQPSFSDILVELSTQTTYNGLGRPQVCGKQIKIIPTESAAPDFNSWVKDVVQDLTSILTVGGVKMPILKTSLLPAKIEPLLKLAYNLRLALAERDICGGLEIAAPSADVPFHPQFMEDAEEFAVQKSRKRKVESPGLSWLDGEYIAGTNGIGLKRTLNGQPGVYEMVVKPKVSLIRVLEMVF